MWPDALFISIDTIYARAVPSKKCAPAPRSAVLCMLSRAAQSLSSSRSQLVKPSLRYWRFSGVRLASSNAATLQAIRDGFSEVRSALALVNRGERLSVAQSQVSELSKELEVR